MIGHLFNNSWNRTAEWLTNSIYFAFDFNLTKLRTKDLNTHRNTKIRTFVADA